MDKEIEKLKKSVENIKKVLVQHGLKTEPAEEGKIPDQKPPKKK